MKEEKKKKNKVDNILRETTFNYVRMIGDADRKARIMLVVNSVFLTLSVTLISKVIINIPYGWIFALILMLSNVLSLFFSIQSVRPELNKLRDDETENNIFHYKKCSELNLAQYSDEMRLTLLDENHKTNAFVKETYYYGKLLALKYRLLKVAYHFFSWGILLATIAYIILLVIVNQHA